MHGNAFDKHLTFVFKDDNDDDDDDNDVLSLKELHSSFVRKASRKAGLEARKNDSEVSGFCSVVKGRTICTNSCCYPSCACCRYSVQTCSLWTTS